MPGLYNKASLMPRDLKRNENRVSTSQKCETALLLRKRMENMAQLGKFSYF